MRDKPVEETIPPFRTVCAPYQIAPDIVGYLIKIGSVDIAVVTSLHIA